MTVDGKQFVLELCERHNDMLDRDMGKWTDLGVEIERHSVFNAEVTSDARRIANLRTRELHAREERDRADMEATRLAKRAESDARRVVPGTARWDLTAHAKERLTLRGFSYVDVFLAVTQPELRIEQPWKGPSRAVYIRGDCRVAVSQSDGVIITVMDRDAVLEQDPRLVSADS